MLSKPKIKQIKSLEYKKFRDKLGLFVAEGEKLVSEILLSDFEVDSVFALPTANLPQSSAPIEIISEQEMKRISFLKTPSSVLALAKIKTKQINLPRIEQSLTLVLDDVQDPGNMGTIIRLADWFGIDNIVCSATGVDCFSPKVVQATMGAICRVNLFYVDLIDFLEQVGKNMEVYGTFLDGENIYNQALSPTGLIVMGNEGRGISPEIEKFISKKLHIPCCSTADNKPESLNVAVATAIACSEFKRRL